MQNRIVLSDIPSLVPKLPNSLETLRDLLEDHGCWVDRLVFLDDDECHCHVVAEFHVENIRNPAIQSLNNADKAIALDQNGNLCDGNKEGVVVQFAICASPATTAQSKCLVEQCPIEDSKEKRNMDKQIFKLPLDDIELVVHRSEEAGGTGTDPWRGGVILAQHIIQWYGMEHIALHHDLSFASLFCNKRILELGAGSSGLPSMALAKLRLHRNYPIECLIATDGVDEIVRGLQTNITHNHLEDHIAIQYLNWCDALDEESMTYDTILFADCIYNEEGANALFQTCSSSLLSGENIIGVLPDFRVGVRLFEDQMEQSGFLQHVLTRLDNDESGTDKKFVCSGSAGTHYRIVWWRRKRVAEQT